MDARVAFDTPAFVKRLEAAGMSVPQAEALAEAMGDIVLQSIATKSDLGELELSLRSDISDLRDELRQLEIRLTMRTGAMMGASTALTVAILGALVSLH